MENNKFIVSLNGGLGNQMFQYAYIKALAKRNKKEFLLDFSNFETYKLHNPDKAMILNLNIENNAISKNKLETLKGKKIKTKCPGFLRKVLGVKKYKIVGAKIKTIKEQIGQACIFDKTLFDLKNPTYIEGYFQSEKYFKKIKKDLLKDFLPKDGFSDGYKGVLKEIKDKKHSSISLHIRRGDYISNPETAKIHGGCCPINYYEKAIEFLKNNIKNPKIFIFSNDLKWVKENIKTDVPMIFVDCATEKTPYEDIWLMANCNHNIIANSSFSWWGAWLNENNNKIVIAPKKWFNKEDMGFKDIYSEDWKKI